MRGQQLKGLHMEYEISVRPKTSNKIIVHSKITVTHGVALSWLGLVRKVIRVKRRLLWRKLNPYTTCL